MDQSEALKRLRFAGILGIAAVSALSIAAIFLTGWRSVADGLATLALLPLIYAAVTRGGAEASRGEDRDRFRSLFEKSPSPIVEFDADGAIRAVNPQFELMLGYRSHELVGRQFDVLVTHGRLSLATARLNEMLTGSTRSFEGWFLCKDGTEVLTDITPIPVVANGDVDGVFLRCRNLTSERALTNRSETGDERLNGFYRLVSSSADVGLMIDEALSFGVRALKMTYGYVTQLSGDTITILHRYGPGDLLPIGFQMPATSSIGRRLAASSRAIAIEDLTSEPYATELRERRLPWKSYIGSRVAVDGAPFGALIFLDEAVRGEPFDATDLDFIDLMSGLIGAAVAREIKQKQLQEFASNDALTGLPNRRSLEDRVRHALRHAKRTNGRVAIHYIDLDTFKPINDRYGHAAGDDVLRETSRRLEGELRGSDLLARIGGDEFVAVQTPIHDDGAIAALARRFSSAISAPMSVANGESISVTASIGSAVYPKDGTDFGTLLEAADTAMFATKQARSSVR